MNKSTFFQLRLMAVEQSRQYIQQLMSERAERASRQRANEPEYKVQTIIK